MNADVWYPNTIVCAETGTHYRAEEHSPNPSPPTHHQHMAVFSQHALLSLFSFLSVFLSTLHQGAAKAFRGAPPAAPAVRLFLQFLGS